jgi:hypothetical protein
MVFGTSGPLFLHGGNLLEQLSSCNLLLVDPEQQLDEYI